MPSIMTLIAVLLLSFLPALAQSEILTNARIVEMSRAGLDKQIILKKINDAPGDFDVSTAALIELKKSGVETEVIASMMEKAAAKSAQTLDAANSSIVADRKNYSDSAPVGDDLLSDKKIPTPKEALSRAKSLALIKSSVHPSRQALEKELMKRDEWRKYNLTIVRYKEEADIYVEIGYVSLSWITHRYVFRVYDRRSGTIITAGETTSWGNLARNLAREITQKLEKVGAE